MSKTSSLTIFTGQFLHLATLALLLAVTFYVWCNIGSPHPLLFWITIVIPIVHQIFIWITWRTELKSKAISKSMGFRVYQIIFFALLAARPISHFALGWVDQNSLGMNITLRILMAIALFIPAIYTVFSVKKYFSFLRASGADHFDSKYQNMPLVKKGVFKYSSNGMYVFGFLLFWAIAVALDSKAALLASAFVHVYIWVHYYATEKPDMNYLYSSKD